MVISQVKPNKALVEAQASMTIDSADDDHQKNIDN